MTLTQIQDLVTTVRDTRAVHVTTLLHGNKEAAMWNMWPVVSHFKTDKGKTQVTRGTLYMWQHFYMGTKSAGMWNMWPVVSH
jgi:hypothetical protein